MLLFHAGERTAFAVRRNAKAFRSWVAGEARFVGETEVEHQNGKTVSGLRILWVSAGSVVALGASIVLTGRCTGALAQFVMALRAACGLTILFFVPGLFVVPWICRQGTPSLSVALGWAFACNVVLLVSATTALKCFGGAITPGSFFVVLTLLSLLTGAAFLLRFRHWTVRNDMLGLGCCIGVGSLLLLAFVALTTRPILPSEHDYFTNRDSWKQLAAMAAMPIDLAQRGASYEFGDGWHKTGEHRYQPAGRRAMIRFHNPGPRFTFRLSVVVQNYEPFDVRVDLEYASERIHSRTVPSRFIRCKFWDNRQSNNAMTVVPVAVLPGATELTISLGREGDGVLPSAVDLIVHDFSNLDRDALWKRFARRFIITKIDDVRQHLSLARSLEESLLPVDNTGRTFILDFPLHYWLNIFTLALLGDRIESLWLGYLARMIIVLVVLLRGALPSPNTGGRHLITLLAALTLMSLAKFLPIGEGAIFHDSTIVMLLAALALFAAEGQWPLAVVMACLVSLTQRPIIMYVGLFMLLGLVWRQDRRVLMRCLAIYIGFLLLAGAVTLAVGKATGDWAQWQERFAREDSRKFDLLREMVHIPGVTIPYLLRRTWTFWLLILTGAGFLPFAMLAGRDRLSVWVLVTTLLYLLPVTVGYIHRIHYASVPAAMFCLAGLRALATMSSVRRRWIGAMAVGASAACVTYVATASRDWDLRSGHRTLYASLPPADVADGYLARASDLARAGRTPAALRCFERAAFENPGHRRAAYAAIADVCDATGRHDAAQQWRQKVQALAAQGY